MSEQTEFLDPEQQAKAVRQAVAVWRKAQVVYDSHPRLGPAEALVLTRELAQHRESEEELSNLLSDPNQLVVAYALITLELMESEKLLALPNDLLMNGSNLTIQAGSFRSRLSLGVFAKRISERARAKSMGKRQGTNEEE